MTAVAIHAVVHVSAHTLVFRIRVRFGVAVRALEHAVVTRIDMAGGADTVGVAMIHVEPGMVESRTQPAGRRVTRSTARRKARRQMIRVGGTGIVRFVTAVTIRRQRRVVVVHVTAGAHDRGVRPGQWERRIVVVEGCRAPRCRAVAHVALLRESERLVIRIGRSQEVIQVTSDASCVGKTVIRTSVTLAARQRYMCPGKRPPGAGVIKRGIGPVCSAVADLALLRDTGRSVVGIGRSLVILQVARNTGVAGQVEVATGVALAALQVGVAAGQRESHRVVIESGRLPRGRRVTLLASLREPQRNVVRVTRLLEIRQVAAHAGRGRPLVFPADVTGRAVQARVHSRQREAGVLQVIELGAQPGIDGVTLFALGGKPAGHVIRRVCLLVGVLVARVALNRQPLELADRGALMAIRAIQAGVSADQRKPVFVVPRQLQGDVPPFHGVTLFTAPHSSAMDVCMAVGATGSRVRKHWFGMALRATHALVQAAQGKARFVMIEFRHGPNRFPPYRCVAVLAGNAEVAVRAARDRLIPYLPESRHGDAAE